MTDDNHVTYFAETDSRNKRTPFGIKNKDRTRHMYVIGKTGMGKSTLLENMAIQDIQNGEGMCFIDPHGKTADLLLEYVPQERIKDVVYFAPFDTEHPISFNVMEDVGQGKRHLVANGLMSAFKKIWVDAWSARMEYILNNILLALLEYPGSTLIGVNRMLADKDYRKKVVENIKDPSVKSFWVDEFAKYGERYMQEAGAAIQNKIGQFISNPLVRNIIGQPKSSFDVREVMDKKKILIINLSKGRVGEANANLLGSMIITKIYLGALSRADVTETKLKTLPPFYLYVDEFQSFANESFADILSEARKYKLSLTVAHQYIEQMSEEVRDAVFGNVGTMISFRVGAFDSEVFEKEFAPVFVAEDLVNLGFAQVYLKLMIDGVSSQPFSATTLPPIKKPDISFRDDIIEHSRKVFAQPKVEVEEAIVKWHEPVTGGTGAASSSRSRESREPRAESGGKPAGSPMSSPVSSPAPKPQTDSKLKNEPGAQPAQMAQPTQAVQPDKPRQPETPRPQTPKTQVQSRPPYERIPTQPQFNPRAHAPSQHQTPPPTPNGNGESASTANTPPISLNTLKKTQSKGPTPQNLSQLKDALKDIVEKAKKDEIVKPAPEPKVDAQKTKIHHQAVPSSVVPKVKTKEEEKPEKKNEVSEDVLRRILG